MSRRTARLATLLALALVGSAAPAAAQAPGWPADQYLRAHYTKREVDIAMRDGVALHTVIYSPRAGNGPYPILLTRTPYSAGPYGPDRYARFLGPGPGFAAAGYHFVSQDVRGRYRSQGRFQHMTPYRPNKGPRDVDETTDAYDTIDWLVRHLPGNNGRVGLWGISYGGFFAAEGLIDAHPALRAVSPQAPQADWFLGDDTHRNGAFFLTSTFNFMAACGRRAADSAMTCGRRFDFGTDDGYRFFLELGPLANVESRYFKGDVPGWTEMMEHGTYDAFWRARSILPHLVNVRPAVLTVGGWYDANNFYGAIKVFEAIERQSPATDNAIVIGPWMHGQWARDSGRRAGALDFGANTSPYYHESILLPFFEHHLKGTGPWPHPKAWVFETGANAWRTFDAWPPPDARARAIHLAAAGRLAQRAPEATDRSAESWVSDPASPVPFVGGRSTDMDPDYMARDQRFAESRPDVVSYRGEVLQAPLTIAGAVRAELVVSTSGTDGDWVVKLIDVHPDGFQQLVRGDVMRARFRRSMEHPEAMTPDQPTEMAFDMPDVFHTFRPGHRMLVQVQGSWFPLVDRNPQTFVDIYRARAEDFRAATQRVHRGSRIVVRVIERPPVP